MPSIVNLPMTPTPTTPDTTPITPVTPVTPPVVQPSADLSSVRFTSVDITANEREGTAFTITATSNKAFGATTAISVVNPANGAFHQTSTRLVSDSEIAISMQTSNDVLAGVYVASPTINICQKTGPSCNTPDKDGTFHTSVKLNIVANSAPSIGILSRLSALPKVPAWSTYQGSAAHAGYVPGTFNPGTFTHRWHYTPAQKMYSSDSIIDNGIVFTQRSTYIANTSDVQLVATSEDTGQELWRLKQNGSYSAIAVDNGKVYVVDTGSQFAIQAYDQRTGMSLSQFSLNAPDKHASGLTIADGQIYVGANGASTDSERFTKINLTSNQVAWTTLVKSSTRTSATIDKNYAYLIDETVFNAVDIANGNLAYSINLSDLPQVGSMSTSDTVALSNNGRAFMRVRENLVAVDTASRARLWALNGKFYQGQPMVANNVVYIFVDRPTGYRYDTDTVMEAHSAADGALLWTSELLRGTSILQGIVTDNLAFLTSLDTTWAIDLKTHKIVWSYPLGGALSISNKGVLYISRYYSGHLTAINLQ